VNDAHEERLQRFGRAGLYLVTSRLLSRGRTTPEIVRAALAAGVRLIQLREKELCARDLVALGREIRRMTADAGALLIVNDRVDAALEIRADGVHLGQEDLPVAAARRLAPDLIIGASTHSAEEAHAAVEAGASYVNIGPLFPTRSKEWGGTFLGIDGLRRIAGSLSIPFTVMGGIRKEHIPDLVAAGARTVAVVTAVTAADDPQRAAAELLASIASEADRAGAGIAGPQGGAP